MFENPDEIVEDEEIIAQMATEGTDILLPTNYLSYSQINLYMLCGERYRRKYVMGQRQPSSSNMAHGRLLHKVIEEMHLYKRDNQSVPPREFHNDLLTDKLDEYFEEVEVWEDKIPDLKRAEKTGRRLLDLYHEKRLPEVRVRDVERKITAKLRDRIPFLGYVDLVERGPMDNTDFNDPLIDPLEVSPTDGIRDVKITGRKYPPSRVENSLQLTLYAHILGVEDVGYDLLVETKKARKISYVPQRSTRSQGEKEHALDVVEDVAEAIASGVFMKTDPDSWMCSKKWCPFYDECRGKHTQVPGVSVCKQESQEADEAEETV